MKRSLTPQDVYSQEEMSEIKVTHSLLQNFYPTQAGCSQVTSQGAPAGKLRVQAWLGH